MPVVSLPVPSIERTVIRPAVLEILDRLKELSIITNDTPIILPGTDNKIKLPNTYKTTTSESMDSGMGYLYATMSYTYNESDLASTHVRHPDYPPIWSDPDVNATLYPNHVSTDIEISVTYKSKSKESIIAWYNEMRLKVSRLAEMNTHTIEYEYIVPYKFYNLIRNIYLLKKNVDTDIGTILDYIQYGSHGRLVAITNSVSSNIDLGVHETQSRIIGRYDFSPLPDFPEYDDDKIRHTVSFTYKLTIDVPIEITAKYRPIIYNQLLPPEYVLPDTVPDDIEERIHDTPDRLNGLHHFESPDHYLSKYIVYPDNYYKIPEWDDWKIPRHIPHTATVLTALCMVDQSDPTLLVNLNDLDPISIHPDILTWLKDGEYNYVNLPYKSIMHVGAYSGNRLMSWKNIYLDSRLNVRSKIPLDMKKEYHVVISLVLDVSMLSQRATDAVLRSQSITTLYLSALNDEYINHPSVVQHLTKRHVTPTDLKGIFRYYVENVMTRDLNLINAGMKTVQTHYILASRLDK